MSTMATAIQSYGALYKGTKSADTIVAQVDAIPSRLTEDYDERYQEALKQYIERPADHGISKAGDPPPACHRVRRSN